ncbi:MAG: sigma-54-dependent transcriptional regulator [Oligoflexus sp.]
MLDRLKVLIVEDDKSEIKNIAAMLKALNAEYSQAITVSEAVRDLIRYSFDFLLTDLHIETRAGIERPDGLTVIAAAIEHQPNITIVATSNDPRTEIVNDALAAGAHHFIRKPLSKADEIEIAFRLADERRRMAFDAGKATRRKKPSGHWEKFAKIFPYGIVLGEREQKIARLVAKKQASCIIVGETGTGKEEAAKLIHRLRCEEEGAIPFVAVNCATITGNLAESILFGHKKGAFTGADEAGTGYITEADRGILFLDEIQTLSIPIQQKLLRVLNDGTYNRLGETKVHKSQFQLIVASTKDLSDEVAEGRFLVDIQMRMMGLELSIPPLRARPHDMAALVALFLSRKSIVLEQEVFNALVARLQKYSWIGNIRQLFKCLEAWLLNCELDDLPLTADNFPEFKDLAGPRPAAKAEDSGNTDFSAALGKDYDLEKIVEAFEKSFIESALRRHPSIAECCRAINVPRSTLDAKRKKYGLL